MMARNSFPTTTLRVSDACNEWRPDPFQRNGARRPSERCFTGQWTLMMALEEQIRNYAYQLWEKAGKPEGRDEEFLQAAKAELGAEDEAAGTTDQPNRTILPG